MSQSSKGGFIIGAFITLVIASVLSVAAYLAGLVGLTDAIIGGLIGLTIGLVTLAFVSGRPQPTAREDPATPRQDGAGGGDDALMPLAAVAAASALAPQREAHAAPGEKTAAAAVGVVDSAPDSAPSGADSGDGGGAGD
jgi:hypothetical protein